MDKIDYNNISARKKAEKSTHKVDSSKLNFKWGLTADEFEKMKRKIDDDTLTDGECFGHVHFGKFCVDVQFVDSYDSYISLLYYRLDPDATYGETADGDSYDYEGESGIMFKDFPATFDEFKNRVEKIIECDLEHRIDCKEADLYADVPLW